MAVKTFLEWAKYKDIFGFEKYFNASPNEKKEDENPIKQFNVELMMEYLQKNNLGIKESYVKFINEIYWGDGPGAIRVSLGTGLNVVVERQGIDLEGNKIWITKKIFQIDQGGYGGYEDAVANEIIRQCQKIDETQIDSPKSECELEHIVLHTAAKLRRVAKDIFIFEGISKIDDTEYIIKFGVRGHGVEAPDQSRVEQNQTRLKFDKSRGIIRLMNYNLESPVGGHTWDILHNDTSSIFFPTQTKEEIAETIATTMHWY